MRTCKQCGFPRVIGRYLEWHSDGTVHGGRGITLPILILGVDEREIIFRELSDSIGFSIEPIIVQAQRNVGKELFEMVKSRFGNINIKRIPSNRFFRPQWLARVLVWFIRNQFAGLGVGRLSLVRYRAGEYLVVRFSNPCLVPAVVGNFIGFYESLEEMPGARAEYGFQEEDLIIEMTPSEEEPGAEKRLYLEQVEAGKGPLSYDRCPKCNVPIKMAEALAWDLKQGILRNTESNEREGMIAVQSLFAILRELETELGREVVEILYNAQRKHALRHLHDRFPQSPQEFWEAYLTDLALRGEGYPKVFDIEGNSVSVEILNAYDQDLYAAKIAAGLEKITGKDSHIEWDRREHHHGKYIISVV